jgi:hypothetical protein
MLHRKTWALSLVLVLLMASLTGCMMGGSQMAWPDRELTINIDEALAAQDAGMMGMMSGSVEWTESQFSSFLTTLLQQNTGPNFPIKEIQTYFEPGGKIYARINLGEGVLLGGDTIDAVGSVNVVGGHVVVDLDEASANGFTVAGPVLDALSAQINAQLADPSMGTIVTVSTDTGKIMLGMGGM